MMDILEIEQKERLSREQVAARLHRLADMLATHNDIEFERGGMRFTIPVPDEVDFKVELEVGTDERELEIELTW
jgi:amphi-Trp domain-containing protein